MKHIEIIYKRGHFYDIQTGSRVQIKDNSEFLIREDKLSEYFEKKYNVLKSEELEYKIINDDKVKACTKVLNVDTELFFKIRSLDKDLCLLFTVKLLEDLYLYQTNKDKDKFYDCACQLVDCVDIKNNEKVDYFETTFGKSLSEIYHNTSIQYFGHDRSAIILIYTAFFTDKSLHKDYVLDKFRKN